MLDHCNSHAKCFRIPRDRLKDKVVLDVKLKLILIERRMVEFTIYQ